MASKKSIKSNKKHNFKYAEKPISQNTGDIVINNQFSSSTDDNSRDFTYVISDLKRVLVLGSGLVALQFILWFLVNHTGAGIGIFNSITG